MGLCRRIVDVVETGSTLLANGLVELETISEVSSRFAVNRTAWKQYPEQLDNWIKRFRAAVKTAAE
jgi:ATP phosphoribosyltransferase